MKELVGSRMEGWHRLATGHLELLLNPGGDMAVSESGPNPPEELVLCKPEPIRGSKSRSIPQLRLSLQPAHTRYL